MLENLTKDQVAQIINTGGFAQWEALKSQFTVALCQTIKAVCEENKESSQVHGHWYGLAHKFICNDEAKQRLNKRNTRYAKEGKPPI